MTAGACFRAATGSGAAEERRDRFGLQPASVSVGLDNSTADERFCVSDAGSPVPRGRVDDLRPGVPDRPSEHAVGGKLGGSAKRPRRCRLRGGRQRSRLSLQIDVENVTDNVYAIARESEFSPAQFSIPRLISATAKIRF